MERQLIYRGLARYYDLLYSFKDYDKETEKLKKIIARYKKAPGNTLLDVACGTGKHLERLAGEFECTGLDLNPECLAIARRRVPRAVFHAADMSDFDLGRRFDAVTCLFSSIGYVRTPRRLRSTLRAFARHLEAGGVVIIEPWFTPETFLPGTAHLTAYDGDEVKIARLNVSRRRGGVSIMDFHYLVAEAGKEVRHFADRHELGLFTTAETLAAMKDEGLRARYLKNGFMRGRGVYVGVKP